MDQKKLKTYREKLVQKKQEILEAYSKNKSYGKEADGRARRTSRTRPPTPTPRSSCSASRTRSATCCSSWTRRSRRIDGRPLRRVRGLRGRDGPEAPGGGALGQALHLVPGEAGAGPAVSAPLAAAPAVRLAAGGPGAGGGLPLALPRLRGACCGTRAAGRSARPAGRALPRHPRPLCACGAAPGRGGGARCGRCRRGLNPFAAGREPRALRGQPARGAARAEVPGAATAWRRAWPTRCWPWTAVRRAARPRTPCSCPCLCTRGGGARAASTSPSCSRTRWRGAADCAVAAAALVRRRGHPAADGPDARPRGARTWRGPSRCGSARVCRAGRWCSWTTCSPRAPPPAACARAPARGGRARGPRCSRWRGSSERRRRG